MKISSIYKYLIFNNSKTIKSIFSKISFEYCKREPILHNIIFDLLKYNMENLLSKNPFYPDSFNIKIKLLNIKLKAK